MRPIRGLLVLVTVAAIAGSGCDNAASSPSSFSKNINQGQSLPASGKSTTKVHRENQQVRGFTVPNQ